MDKDKKIEHDCYNCKWSGCDKSSSECGPSNDYFCWEASPYRRPDETRNKELWCIKHPEGYLCFWTMDINKDEVVKDFVDLPEASPIPDWKGYQDEGYSVVEVEVNEKGQHPDTKFRMQMIQDQAEEDVTIKQMAAQVMTAKAVHGDSHSVPGPVEIVESLVGIIKNLCKTIEEITGEDYDGPVGNDSIRD